MKLGYKISLLVIGILLAISTTLGSTYALWTIADSQESSNEVTSGCFSLSYVDVVNDESTSINLINTYPLSDEKGLALSPYTVILTNTCDIAARYELSLTTDQANTLSAEYLKTNLINVTTNTNYNIKKLDLLKKITLDSNIIDEIVNKNNIIVNNTYLLADGVLNPDESVTYEIRMWLDESAPNETMGTKFVGVISNVAYATESK